MTTIDPDIVRLTDGSAVSDLELRLATDALDEWEWLYLTDYDLVEFAGCTLERAPGKGDNWIEKAGGLPPYICEVAKSIHEKRGKSISNSIQIAIGVIKEWAHGKGKVNADTRAKATAALAQWTKMKAAAKAKK